MSLGEKQKEVLRKQVVDRKNRRPFGVGLALNVYDNTSQAKDCIKALHSKGITKKVDTPSIHQKYIVISLPEDLASKWLPK